MSDQPHWGLDLAEAPLRRAGPDGLSKAELQEESGLGAEDLREVLKELEDRGRLRDREDGRIAVRDDLPALEPEPDRREPETPGAPEAAAEPPETPESEEVAVEGAERWAGQPIPAELGVAEYVPLRLTAAMVKALSDETLGALVRAGVEEAEERNEVFALSVEP